MTHLIENKNVVDCISFKVFIFSQFTHGCLESIQSEATLANGTTDSSSFAFGSAAAAARQRYGLRAFSSPSSPNIAHHREARARDLPPIRPNHPPRAGPPTFRVALSPALRFPRLVMAVSATAGDHILNLPTILAFDVLSVKIILQYPGYPRPPPLTAIDRSWPGSRENLIGKVWTRQVGPFPVTPDTPRSDLGSPPASDGNHAEGSPASLDFRARCR